MALNPLEQNPPSGAPFVLVRWDWLLEAIRWLQWCRANVTMDKVKVNSDDPLVPSGNVELFIQRCREQLEELLRVAHNVQLASPVTYMRAVGVQDLQEEPDVECFSMPPFDPSERGN